MKRKFRSLALVTSVMLIVANFANASQWEISQSQSEINFISIKKGSVAEVHHFKNFFGVLNHDGSFLIDIALDSVETNIDIRNQRMNDFLFESKRHPMAVLQGSLNTSFIKQLKVGEQVNIDIPAQLRLHGQKSQIDMSLLVTKTREGELLVSTRVPVLINAAPFELVKGIEKLKELAGLPSIDLVIPVTFNTTWSTQ